jgi:hypothetical protein
MLVYSSTKEVFSDDILTDQIVDKIQSRLKSNIGRFAAPNEVRSFRNSLRYMDKVLQDTAIPNDSGISIEYQIPQTGKRIDFIISGKNEESRDVALLVELKQWESAKLTGRDGLVSTFIQGGLKEVSHPSYQAWSYAALIEDFNETVRMDNVLLKPCAYLHNYVPDDVITNQFYADHLDKAPVFLKPDAIKLREFIKKYVKRGDSGEIMYRIDHGRIRPSKNLADKMASLLKGNQEFIMIDDQKVVYETALALAEQVGAKAKQVLIVEGGPGTGKSVVAVNLLVALINKRMNAQYVTKNAAPRAVYESKLTGTLRKTHIGNLFRGSGAYTDCPVNTFDALVVDESHRLNEKSGMFQNKGENQIKEIICSAKFSIFFIDEDQRVTLKDIGETEAIERWAKKLRVKVKKMALSSQFRCNGSDGYLAWIDNTLQVRETVNTVFDGSEFDLRVLSSPNLLRDLIYEKNKINNKARIVAGYCWDWVSKNGENVDDIVIEDHDFTMRWNLATDGGLWILQPDSVKEAGCIHTCQGLELDYIGVIIGPDLICRDEKIFTDPSKRSRMDASIKGYKKLLKNDPELAKEKMDAIIKNTYRTLMTRGMKGCYIYCVDKELEDFLKSRIKGGASPEAPLLFSDVIKPHEEERIKIEEEVSPELQFKEYLPLYSLEAACGRFGEGQEVLPLGWVKVDGKFKLNRNMFVIKAIGSSMEPKIMDGAHCILRANVVGSRNGKIVLVELRQDADPDTGRYTIKRYSSRKAFKPEGEWEHEKIVLEPLNNAYEKIVLDGGQDGELKVVAEFVGVI